MESNNTLFFVFISVLLFHSIPVSLSQKANQFATSSNPPVLIPRLETWARAMQLSFRSISEPPMISQFPSHASRMASVPYLESLELESESESDPLLPRPFKSHTISTVSAPFLHGNSDVLEKTMKSIAWLIKLGAMQAQRLSNKFGNPTNEAKILNSCKDSYDNASSSLQEAIKALSSKNADRMNSMLKAVLSNVVDCREEYSGKRSPLATYDDKITKMTINCLVVLDLVNENR